MKKGNISVNKSKKGFAIILTLDTGSHITPSSQGFKDDFLKGLPQNKQVFYEYKNNLLDIVSLDMEKQQILFSRNPIQKPPVIVYPPNPSMTSIGEAHAPYNFIPINESVVASPFEYNEIQFNVFNNDLCTGVIDLNLKALTPLYIRGMTPLVHGFLEKNPDFFRGKDYCIPGSSLRGVIRTILEIVSYSKMGSINKNTSTQRFHYRAFADQSLSLREEYSSKMLAVEDNPLHYFPKINAGVIKKEGLNYYIRPGKHYKVEENLVKSKNVLSQLMSFKSGDKYKANKSYEIGFKPVFFKADQETIHQHHKKLLKYAKVTDIAVDNKMPGLIPGYLIHSGWMIGPAERPQGKHMHWVVGNINETIRINIPPEVIENYNDDKLRDSIDLIGMLNNKKTGIKEVPCFYSVDHLGNLTSFGYTGMFRLAYDRTLIEFLPDGHRTMTPDFTEVLFGKNDIVPSRVFIEDAFLQEGAIVDKVLIPSILGTPKPTTFQHYLRQEKNTISTVLNKRGQVSGFKGIVDYNQNGTISGNKLYWHHKSIKYPSQIEISEQSFKDYLLKQDKLKVFPHFDVKNNRIIFTISTLSSAQHDVLIKYILSQDKVQYTAMKPILSDAKFIGRIRFENLSEVELGALLFVLNLPDHLCYKIGMGKSLGFGSIKILPKIYLSNRAERYSNLKSEWSDTGINQPELTNEDITKITLTFERFVLDRINSKATSLWEEGRMNELKTMLDFRNCLSGIKSEYMLINKTMVDKQNNPVLNDYGIPKTVNEYKSRPILPKPSEYLKSQ